MTNKKNNAEKVTEAASYTVGGAATGGAISAVVGGMGLAVGGTAIAIGMGPVAAAGGVIGLAAYGLKKTFEDED